MRIDERLTSEEPSFSFEFFPPKTDEGERNLGRALAELSRLGPTFVSVTYGAAGIENVLALRGDPPQGQAEWRPTEGGLSYSRELIELIRGEYDFAIGAACFPEVHIHAKDAESDLRYLKEKVDAGARFLITQLFFENQAYYEFVARARDIGIDVPIIPGIMPITDYGQIKRITGMCGATIPGGLLRELELRGDQPGSVTDLGVAYP